MKLKWIAVLAGLLLAAAWQPSAKTADAKTADAGQAGFTLQDAAGEHLDVLLDGKIVGRYMYAHDTSTPDRRAETYKPYLHVFDAEGTAPITKGPGGQFTHHRGIFIGWNKITANGKSFDRWHMPKGEIVHQKFLERKADADSAVITSLTHWNDDAGKPFMEEERTMTFHKSPGPGRLVIDFTTQLKAVDGEVKLDGDPEHAGIQFRPANEVVTAETNYVFPKAGAQPTKDVDYPWVGETFTLNGKRYSVVEMNHPDNPKQTRFSAYRDYGRFGAFPVATVAPGKPLTLKYEFVIGEGEMPPAGEIQRRWDAFAGSEKPTPAPEITRTGGANKDKKKAGAATRPAAAKTGAKKPADKETKPADKTPAN